MKKIRLKYAIAEFDSTLYEVNLTVSHQEDLFLEGWQTPCGKPSEAQRAQRQRFKEAVAYSKAALADPELRAHYHAMAQKQGKSPWGAAMADYLAGSHLLSKN